MERRQAIFISPGTQASIYQVESVVEEPVFEEPVFEEPVVEEPIELHTKMSKNVLL